MSHPERCAAAPGAGAAAPRRWRGLRVVALVAEADPGAREWLAQACQDRASFRIAERDADRADAFANSDVIAVPARDADCDAALAEALASGCFPVVSDTGPAREWIRSGVNGLVVDPTHEAFRRALQWCATHSDDVRRAGRLNARLAAGDPVARAALARGVVPARFAFVTPEYAGERDARDGGLGSYVRNAARALTDRGHEVEVFTSGREDAVADDAGVRVQRVREAISRRSVRALLRVCRWLDLRRVRTPLIAAVDALLLARALAERERSDPFDAVQSADVRATGLFIAGRVRSLRPHLVRASHDGAELASLNGEDAAQRSWLDALERRCLRRADVAYAPSRRLARHYAERWNLPLRVARPPAPCITVRDSAREDALPKRFFVHFGQLTPAKGSADLAAALPLVWKEEPDFEMVWAGVDRGQRLPAWRNAWGARRRLVHWLGALSRPDLHAIVARADAAVLPTRFDNLPNTVIESLALGVPVIGTDGASVEELVTPGRDGDLVPIGDPAALAAAIVARWRAPRARTARLPTALEPGAAADALLALAGLRDGPVMHHDAG
jgi:glycosyltransferase involved in cell wall biosynthesis